jgi:hypothetical protein
MEIKMNKIALSLIALAAFSTASLASGNRSWDLQDSPDNPNHFVAQNNSNVISVLPFSDFGSGKRLSNSEIIKRNMMTNESSSH